MKEKKEKEERVYIEKGGVISIYEGEEKELKGFGSIILTMTKELELEEKRLEDYIRDSNVEGYRELKERRERGELEELEEGDVLVLTTKGELKERGVEKVIVVIVPEWDNGIKMERKLEKISNGMRKALDMTIYHNIGSVTISDSVYKDYPRGLIADLLVHYVVNYRKYKLEICISGEDRVRDVLELLLVKEVEDVYIREGVDLLEGVLRQIEGAKYSN